ncbi:MAG: iron ABC transporter permease [Dehalococcoidia bacterium]|nr:iron ABC transporter permease [Dehalococcoidia bacterium]
MASRALTGFLRGEKWEQVFTARNIIVVLATALVAFLAAVPIFFLLWNSFKPALPGHLADFSLNNFTLSHFREAYSNPDSIGYLGNTLLFAAGSMAVALFFGGSIAFLVERTNTPFRNAIYGLMFIPLVMPGMLKAISWVLLLSPSVGLLNTLWKSLGFAGPLFNAYSIPAMWWVEGLSMSPLTFFLLGAAFRSMDPSLEEAAYTSGANRATTLFRITFRMMAPALAAVALLMFVRGLESMDVPLILGAGRGLMVYSTQIYIALRVMPEPQYGQAFVFSLVLMVLAFEGLMFYQRVLARSERYATVTGKGYRPRLLNLGKWRGLTGAFVFFFIFVGFILPLLVLLWSSFLLYFQFPSREALASFSLNNYRDLFARRDFLLMIRNTAILAGIVSVGGMLLATVVSWIVIRLKPRGGRVLDVLAFLPMSVPAVAMAFSFMIVFLYWKVGIYGTIWIMVLAYLIRFLPTATRFTHSGVSQIHKELEDAAATSGAGFVTVMRRILIPLILPTLISGGLYVFILASKVFEMAALLYTPDTLVLSVYIFQLWTYGSTPLVGALAVLMVILLFVMSVAFRKLAQRRAMVAEA